MVLEELLADKRVRLKAHKDMITEGEMIRFASSSMRRSCGFKQALAKRGLSMVGELKNAVPGTGEIVDGLELSDRIRQYSFSVDAISCVTEEDHFDGSVEYFKDIREMTDLPMLRKDFVIDEYQIYEAKTIGADAVLLIAEVLDDATLTAFYRLTTHLGMDAMVEVHDEAQMERAARLGADIISVSNRSWQDFSVDLERTKRLCGMAPKGSLVLSDGGITGAADIRFLNDCGVDALLIGTALMQSAHPFEQVREWKQFAASHYQTAQKSECGL